ncbi:MAG: pantetheine-phosphate adenylyltransferase [Nitrospiraceae bacterium]|jgi:pantetheine-phosphate adenylyltransferase|nr:MAG: pantetheine-phosphate adenylyltransferase [Nitrospiraceae bacterium]
MKKRIAIYPGTFDPFTNGHLDLVERGLTMFDTVIVALAPSRKKKPLFSVRERISMMNESMNNQDRASVEVFSGLLVDYVKKKGGIAIIRGLRAISDFEFELQMALMNRRLHSGIETVFMMPNVEYSFLTATIVKEIASFGGDITGLVPEPVENALKEKFKAI